MPAGGGSVTGVMGRALKGGGVVYQKHGARILASRYTLADEIGRGASGVVFKALDMQSGGMVAIKEVAIRGESKEQMQLLQREIDLLKLLKNPYIVGYRESFNTRDQLFIVMEFVENGSLSLIIKKFGRLQESLVIIYMIQILEGLTFLHEQVPCLVGQRWKVVYRSRRLASPSKHALSTECGGWSEVG